MRYNLTIYDQFGSKIRTKELGRVTAKQAEAQRRRISGFYQSHYPERKWTVRTQAIPGTFMVYDSIGRYIGTYPEYRAVFFMDIHEDWTMSEVVQ